MVPSGPGAHLQRKRLNVTFILAVAVTIAVLSAIGIHLQTSIATEAIDAPRRPSRVRLVVLGLQDDQGERERMFNEDLRGRCVVDPDVRMVSSGTWSVRCGSGRKLLLVYDRQGNLAQVVDLVRVTLSSLPEDEPERRRLFDRALDGRCQVISSLMQSPGTWMAECQSGARYRLVFEEGRLRQSMEIPAGSRGQAPLTVRSR